MGIKKVFLVAGFLFLVSGAYSQNISQRLEKAFATFEKDEQLKHAISSFYVIDAATEQVVFDKNSQIGLAPASTQKIITSVTAFELLGKDYQYQTKFTYFPDRNNKNNS
jgi:D-alanyl-D-alanine carboxypeptidase/D-alanyl-D-alanine-endopeptidase (penicillin-binding protein 4)